MRSAVHLMRAGVIAVAVGIGAATAGAGVASAASDYGVIKWYNAQKHYGFISSPDGSEVFFHELDVLQTGQGGPRVLLEGTRVTFNRVLGRKGYEAQGVSAIAATSPTNHAKATSGRR